MKTNSMMKIVTRAMMDSLDQVGSEEGVWSMDISWAEGKYLLHEEVLEERLTVPCPVGILLW